MVAEVDGPLARYRLLASAIAGRAVDVAPAAGADRPWTDGSTVFVAADASPQDQVRAIVVQAALLERRQHRSRRARRARTPSGADPAVSRGRGPPGARRSGCRPSGSRPCAWSTTVVAARTDSPAASLELARSREAIADPPECFGTIRPKRVRVPQSGAPIATEPTAHVARRETRERVAGARRGRGRRRRRVVARHLHESHRGQRRDRTPARSHVHQSTVERDRPARCGRADPHDDPGTRGRATGVASSAHAPPDRHRGSVGALGRRLPRVGRAPAPLPPRLVHGRRDAAEARRARSVRAAGRARACGGRSRGSAVALDRRHRQPQGDDIDIDAAVEARVEPLAGSAPDEAVYIDSVRRRRDLSVLVLLDVSGSAAEPSADGRDRPRAAAARRGRADARAARARRPRRALRVSIAGPLRRHRRAGQALRRRTRARRVPAPRRPRARRLHAPRRGDPPRHGGRGARRRNAAPAARRAFRRVRVRPRLRGRATARPTRVARSPKRAGGARRACVSASAPAPTPAALRRVFGTAAHATSRARAAAVRRWPAVPLGAALCGGATASVAAQASGRASACTSRGEPDDARRRGRTTCRSATRSRCSRPRSGRACRSCSRARPAAARRASSRRWRTTSGGR